MASCRCAFARARALRVGRLGLPHLHNCSCRCAVIFVARRTMASLKRIHTEAAPSAIGPYSQAVVANGMAFVSGQIPLDPATMEIRGTTVTEQTELVLKNLKAVLEAAGSNFDNVAKTTVFLKDMNTFAEMNAVYEKAFGDARPARAAVEVARLPRDVLVEIECVAVVPK
eukprot:m.171148 g.171148  ORF g.171148 m.171148 type:complete len:170 (-) comp10385_c0_seq1:37-546(-)